MTTPSTELASRLVWRRAVFDFIRKETLWRALDDGSAHGLEHGRPFQLKTVQDAAVFARLAGCAGLDVAEAGGGDSRVLRALAARNRCVNIEKFDGADGGPDREVKIKGVRNVSAFLGEACAALEPRSFDVVFSISVVEHVPTAALDAFLEDGLRILRPGGLWLHAIDVYLEDEPPPNVLKRVDIYRSWARREGVLEPVGPVYDGPTRFSCDMASNPDNVMYEWGKVAPALDARRRRAQCVSVLIASRKVMDGNA